MGANVAQRIAVIGSGYWGRNLVRNFHQLGALHTVCDGNPQVEAEIREKYPQAVFRTHTRSAGGRERGRGGGGHAGGDAL